VKFSRIIVEAGTCTPGGKMPHTHTRWQINCGRSKSKAIILVLVAVALCMMSNWIAGDAFLAGSGKRMEIILEPRGAVEFLTLPTTSAVAPTVQLRSFASAFGFANLAGCVALLAAAVRRSSSADKPSSKSIRAPRAVVRCIAAPVTTARAPLQSSCRAVTQKVVEAADLVSFETTSQIPSLEQIITCNAAGVDNQEDCHMASSSTQHTSKRSSFTSARRVGSSRCSAGRQPGRRASRAAMKASRRHHGACLQQHPIQVVPAPAFDPSRLRSKIQKALRTPVCMRIASGREFKTLSAARSCTVSSGERIKANHLYLFVS